MSFIIRNFEEKDLPHLAELKGIFEDELGWKPSEGYLEEFSKVVLGICRKDPNLIKVVVIDDRLIGYCISTSRLHSYEGIVLDITSDSAYVWDIFITKVHRRQGIGQKLLDEVISYLKEIGKRRVFLVVNHWNEDGKKFFERNNFRLWGYFLNKEISS